MAGDFLYWVALVVFLTAGGDGARWVSIALVARLLPYLFFGAIGGVIADRLDRRRLLIGLDVTRSLIFFAMSITVFLDGPRSVAVALVFIAGMVGATNAPALVAIAPSLLSEDDLAAGNAAQSGLSHLSWFVGPALGARLVVVLDLGAVILLDAITFLVSALLVSRIEHHRSDATIGEVGEAAPGVFAELLDGIALLRHDRGLVATTLFACGGTLRLRRRAGPLRSRLQRASISVLRGSVCELVVIPGDLFVSVVSHGGSLPVTISRTMHQRLLRTPTVWRSETNAPRMNDESMTPD